MKLKDILAVGLPVVGSPLDGVTKPLHEISNANKVRHGYIDSDGELTEKGENRTTTIDYNGLEASSRAMAQQQRARDDELREAQQLSKKIADRKNS